MRILSNTFKQQPIKSTYKLAICALFGLISYTGQAQNQERVVSGVVNSLDGPVAGASIVLEGTATGVLTDENGAFTFPVELKLDDVLVFSYFGYETAKVVVEEDTSYVTPFLEDIAVVITGNLRLAVKKDPSKVD